MWRGAGAQEWLAREEVKMRSQLHVRQLRMREDLDDGTPSVGLSDRSAASAATGHYNSLISARRMSAGTEPLTPGRYSVASGGSARGIRVGGEFQPQGRFSTDCSKGSSKWTGSIVTL